MRTGVVLGAGAAPRRALARLGGVIAASLALLTTLSGCAGNDAEHQVRSSGSVTTSGGAGLEAATGTELNTNPDVDPGLHPVDPASEFVAAEFSVPDPGDGFGTVVIHEPLVFPEPLPGALDEYDDIIAPWTGQDILVRIPTGWNRSYGFSLCLHDADAGWGGCVAVGVVTPATPVKVPRGEADLEFYLLTGFQRDLEPVRRLHRVPRDELAGAYRLKDGFDSFRSVLEAPPIDGSYLEVDPT